MGRPKPAYVRQVLLSRPLESGGKRTSWGLIDDDPRIVVGKWVSVTNMEDEEDLAARWEVLEMSPPIARHAVKHGWNNNI